MTPSKPAPLAGAATRRERVVRFLRRGLWQQDWAEAPTFKALGVHLLRLFAIAGQGLVVHKCGQRAAALTYYTVLSLVPFLAFAFAVAKGLGAYEHLENRILRPFVDTTFGPREAQLPTIDPDEIPTESLLVVPSAVEQRFLSDDPQRGLRDAIDQVLDFVKGTDVSKLGSIGLAVVLFTVVKLLTHVEVALNDIFGITRARSIPRRVTDYTAMVVIAPILAISIGAVGATATGVVRGRAGPAAPASSGELPLDAAAQAASGSGQWFEVGLSLLPVLAMASVFTLLYLVMPNTKVRVRSALVGGVAAALLWTLVQHLYVKANVGVANYNNLYAGFAAIPLFLVWISLSWTVVLLGAEFARADQSHRAFGREQLAGAVTPAELERAGLRILLRLAAAFLAAEPPWSTRDLVETLELPHGHVTAALRTLAEAQVVVRAETADDSEERWVLIRDPGQLRLEEARRALRGRAAPEEGQAAPADRVLQSALQRFDSAARDLAQNRSLADFAREVAEGAPGDEAPR
jgi:membrane protein